MYSVYQHWDPLEVTLVGRSYPPEFYSWIKNSKTRSIFETMAEETEEDYQKMIKLLDRFNVKVMRPQLPEDFNSLFVNNKWVPPPTAPRDYFLMVHDRFWVPTIPNASTGWGMFYRGYKKDEWPDFVRDQDFFDTMPAEVVVDVASAFKKFQDTDQKILDVKLGFYKHVFDHIRAQGNEIVETNLDFINGCFVSRIGHDLFFATQTYHDDQEHILTQVNELFPTTRNHVVNAGGHGDAVYCPVTPGLIISLNDVPTYADTFPGWEVVYLPPSDYAHMRKFERSIKLNKGRWFLPGFENNQDLINQVEYYFNEWTGQVSETVFDVNILIIDPKNIVVSAHNDIVESACARHGIEVHVNPFRHKYFWDCGMHCITNDLSRRGTKHNFFKE